MFNFAIMGAGVIAVKFCNAIKMLTDVQVIAVASSTANKGESFALANGIPNFYNSYSEMLDRTDIDAVYIATTHNFHHQNTLLCIEKNKPFICEKPLTLTKKDALDIYTKAKAKNLFSMEAMWSRFLPSINKIKGWIDSGKLGQIELVTFMIGFKAAEDGESRIYSDKLAGGALYDIGVYPIEIITYLIQENLLEVKSVLRKAAISNVDRLDSLILKFDHCTASFNALVSANVNDSLCIYGTKGHVIMQSPLVADSCTFYGDNEVVESYTTRADNGFEYQIQEVMDCIRGGKLESDRMPHKATIQCAEIFDACMADFRKQQ